MITGTVRQLIDNESKKNPYCTNLKCYQLNFKFEPRDYISLYISSYVSLDMKRGAIYPDLEEFYSIPENVTNTRFESEYGEYFSGYKVFLLKPNDDLMRKILKFNKLKKTNEMKRKYGKPEDEIINFSIDELIENSDFVFLFPQITQEFDSEILIFFESKEINSINFVKEYFESKGILIAEELT